MGRTGRVRGRAKGGAREIQRGVRGTTDGERGEVRDQDFETGKEEEDQAGD